MKPQVVDNPSAKMLIWVWVAVLCLCASCYDAPEETSASSSTSGDDVQVNIVTRAASGTVEYPVHVYAFDADGHCAAQQVLQDESEFLMLALSSEGTYRITALTGCDHYTMPDKVSQTAQICMPQNNYAEAPLMMGHADVVLGSQSEVNVHIMLHYIVASLSVSLSGIPADMTDVQVTFSDQYQAVSLSGEYVEPAAPSTLPCVQNAEGGWEAGPVYVLPGANEYTILSIAASDATSTENYGYTITHPLEASTPYVLNGIYNEGMTVNGTLTAVGWNDAEEVDFHFGTSEEEVVPEPAPSDTQTVVYDVDVLPQALDVWNGHVVALVTESSASEATLLLISLENWANVYSAVEGSQDEGACAALRDQYQEYELEDWRIPTEEEAEQLRSAYMGNVTTLNSVLTANGGASIALTNSSGDNARYLCEEGTRAFSFVKASRSGVAGKTVKYFLRLVKSVKVRLAAD